MAVMSELRFTLPLPQNTKLQPWELKCLRKSLWGILFKYMLSVSYLIISWNNICISLPLFCAITVGINYVQLLSICWFNQVKALVKLYVTSEIPNRKKNGLCWAVGLHSAYSAIACWLCLYSFGLCFFYVCVVLAVWSWSILIYL